MKNKTDVRVCRNKKCQKVLPLGYGHKYCEACRNQHAENAKNIGKGILGVAGTIGCIAITVVTAGKISPNKK